MIFCSTKVVGIGIVCIGTFCVECTSTNVLARTSKYVVTLEHNSQPYVVFKSIHLHFSLDCKIL